MRETLNSTKAFPSTPSHRDSFNGHQVIATLSLIDNMSLLFLNPFSDYDDFVLSAHSQ